MNAEIRYTRATDGTALAYTVVGEGPPLLFARSFLSPGIDDELSRSSQLWPALVRNRSVVLWDLRGVGLSGAAPEAGFDDWLADMDAVADAAGAERFDLYGMRVPSHLAMAYAARNPQRVSKLVLHGPSPPGTSPRRAQPEWLQALAADQWHDFVDIFALRAYGWEEAAAGHRWADRIRSHFSSEQFQRYMDVIEALDARGDAPSISAPTLVIEDALLFGAPATVDRTAAFRAFTRDLTAAIPGARLAVLKPGDSPAALVEQFLTGRDATRLKREDAPGTAIILFADIADSTALTERIGDGAFREKARALDAAMRKAIAASGGTSIDAKTLGDGVLATFPAAAQAIDAALACGRAGRGVGLPLHLGLHAGDIIREDGNVYGGAVNVAARVSALSAPNEILVSATVRDLARTSAGVTFEDRGEYDLKGIAEAVRIFAVRDGG
jgi:class 3 adenylate cyclase